MLSKLAEKADALSLDKYIIRLLSAWCLTAVFFNIGSGADFEELSAYSGIGIGLFAVVFVLVFAVISLFGFLSEKKEKRFDLFVLPVCFGCFAFLTVLQAENYYFAFLMSALAAMIVFYFNSKGRLKLKAPVSSLKKWGLIILIIAGFSAVSGIIGVLRYKTFSTPNYDFGIFCQMFYNMKESLRPVTTCERDGLLSHFAVHISPVYYLLLPFYFIAPSPVTLQLGQTFVLASSVIPLALIAKKYGLSNSKTVFLAALFMFHPAIISGTGYDLHENCFLLPLLLWMFWAYETERDVPMLVFALLTLTVKEDAAIYILFFAVYVFLGRRNTLSAAVLFFFGAAYFLFALYMLKTYGNGVMSDRYKNYLPNGGTLFDMIKVILADPAYVFGQLLLDNNGGYADKIMFILQLFVPFAFLPFATKKLSNLLLLLPMVLMNLMTVYLYQYDIGFQYHFGVLAFIAYLSVINLSAVSDSSARNFLAAGLCASLILFTVAGIPRMNYYLNKYSTGKADYQIMNEALDEIPDDASVICSTYLLPRLSSRAEVYEDWYHDNTVETDYVILDTRYDCEKYYELYTGLGYTNEKEITGENGRRLMLILTKENADT